MSFEEHEWYPPPEEPPHDDPGYYSQEPPDYGDVPYENEAKGNEAVRPSRTHSPRKNIANEPKTPTLEERVLATIRTVLGSTHGLPTEVAQSVVERVMASPRVLACLSEKHLSTYEGVFEVLSHECGVSDGGILDLSNLPVSLEYSTPVRVELAVIAGESGLSTADPHAVWQALVEAVQRHHTKNAALGLVSAIDNKANVSELMERFRKLEPPTTQKSLARHKAAKTAKAIMAEHKSAMAGRAPMRFSTGLPTLDKGYTGKGQVKGFIAPGELIMVMGPTGTGKSSFSYAITPAMTQDLRNYGLPEAKHVLFHTEEESIDKIEACRMFPGQPYHHLHEQLIVGAIGTSREKITQTLYDLVIEADVRARETKRPITDFLPYVVQLDYLQSITEQGEDEKTATATTSELLLRGVCAWNPEEMAKFSGVDFREYAGMSWPLGMEHHRVAVIAYAQLVKIDGDSERYRESKSKLSDFVLYDDNDNPYWDVNEGDLRLFTKGQMRGSGVVANNAHAIIILHRSVPSPNPVNKALTEPDGVEHLTDTRARILFDKARAGNSLPYAPLKFDRQPDGPKAQYFDELADQAIALGKLKDYDDQFYTGPGSIILPKRPVSNPLDSFRY